MSHRPSNDVRSALHPPTADICSTAAELSFRRPESAYMARERVVAELPKGESDLRSTGSGSNSRYYDQITTVSYSEMSQTHSGGHMTHFKLSSWVVL